MQRMTAILDQRHMSGLRILDTKEQVESFWQEHARRHRANGRPPFPLKPDRDDFQIEKKAALHAYVSDGRWVADCVTRGCRGGVAVWREHGRACCLDCGTIYTNVEWPADDELAAAEETLSARPPENRHWKPWEESAVDLRAENIAHGFPPDTNTKPSAAASISAILGGAIDPAGVERVLRAAEKLAKARD